MKTSNIIFMSTLALIVLLGCVPQLFGIMKKDLNGRPVDFLSQFWYDQENSEQKGLTLEKFSHVHLDGDGRDFFLMLNQGNSDSTKVSIERYKDLDIKVKNDTLFVKSLSATGNAFSADLIHPLKSVTIYHADARTYVDQKLMEDLNVHVSGKSDIAFSRFQRVDADTAKILIPALNVKVSGESNLLWDNFHIEKMNVDLQHGVLSYGTDLQVDTMNVKLVGKSTIHAFFREMNNQVQVVNLSGDKDYFRKESIGLGVRLNVLD